MSNCLRSICASVRASKAKMRRHGAPKPPYREESPLKPANSGLIFYTVKKL